MKLAPTSWFCVLVGLFMVCQPIEMHMKEEETERGLRTFSRREASDTLLFPEDHSGSSKDTLTLRRDVGAQELKPAPCPNGESFCESASDYPKDLVKNLLKKQASKFVRNQFFVEEDPHIDRFGEHPDETSLCPSKPKTVYPNKGTSRDGVLEFIVNEENYKQGIKVESCVNDGDACPIPGSLSLGYTSSCRQKHILRTLVVVNRNVSDVEGFITKPFEFPSCCACMVSMKANRFGFNVDPQPTTPAVKGSSSKNNNG